MDRRQFLRAGIIGAGGATALPVIASVAGAQTGSRGPYGPIDGREPDENGVILPRGFTSRIVGIAGAPVGTTDYLWRPRPDGAATFPTGDGGWIHVVNHEIRHAHADIGGGVSATRYDARGEIVDAYSILDGTFSNCAGGPTPWGTWLSCEEFSSGIVWECDPTGETGGVAHPAMGAFRHEAVAVDPAGQRLYLTEDEPDGRLYRFTPDAYPDLSSGLLEAAVVDDGDRVRWREIPDPSGSKTPTRSQVRRTTAFDGGEGIWFHDGWIYFTTKGDDVVHALDLAAGRLSRVYDAATAEDPVLKGVDNITVDAGSGDLFVAEDGGNMELVLITPEGQVAPFLRLPDQDQSEVTGPVFNPARDRLYFSSQTADTGIEWSVSVPGADETGTETGITYEVTGPFRGAVSAPAAATTTSTSPAAPASPVTTLAATTSRRETDPGGSGGGTTGLVVGGAAAAALAALSGAAVALRNRRR